METDFSFWSMLASATLVVKMVLLLLGGMSLVSWYIIAHKAVQLYYVRRRAMADQLIFEKARDLAEGLRMLKQSQSSPLYILGHAGLVEIKKLERSSLHPQTKARVSAVNLQRALDQAVVSTVAKLEAGLAFLATCANAAPFIGLFGTVWGIMNAFHTIGVQKTAALAAVAPGISEALVATAIGLGVAIPASVSYNLFTGALGRIEREFAQFAGAFQNRVQRELPWISAQSGEVPVDRPAAAGQESGSQKKASLKSREQNQAG